jgi:carboxymethylenebutenolidase
MTTLELDGKVINGYLAVPAGGRGPAVLVLHAWWGLNDFFRGLCDRLAAEGLVAFAPDLYGNGAIAGTVAEAEQLIGTIDFEAAVERVKEVVDGLRSYPAVTGEGIGVVGFSMGAAYALLTATIFKPADVAAVVLFYGNEPGLGAEEFAQSRAAFLGHFAASDPYESPEATANTAAEMGKAGREVTFHVYAETGHWFFEADRPDAYQEDAAQLAWERTVRFLRERLA